MSNEQNDQGEGVPRQIWEHAIDGMREKVAEELASFAKQPLTDELRKLFEEKQRSVDGVMESYKKKLGDLLGLGRTPSSLLFRDLRHWVRLGLFGKIADSPSQRRSTSDSSEGPVSSAWEKFALCCRAENRIFRPI